jgi:hypothetical protein
MYASNISVTGTDTLRVETGALCGGETGTRVGH